MIKRTSRIINRAIGSIKYIWNHPIGKANRPAAFFRYFYFHMYHLFLPQRKQYNWIDGTRFLASIGDAGVTANVYVGLDDFELMAFCLHFLRPGDLFLDVGANFGSYTILAAGVNNAFCIAFEPDKDTFGILQKDCTINNITKLVSAQNIGVGDKPSQVNFVRNIGARNHVVLTEYNESSNENIEAIQLTTIDEIENYPSTENVVWKIDVEGFEYKVLLGAKARIQDQRLRCVIIETNGLVKNFGNSVNDVHNYLTDAGFTSYKYNPFKREISRLDSPDNTNTIYLRDSDFVISRVKSSKTYNIYGVSF